MTSNPADNRTFRRQLQRHMETLAPTVTLKRDRPKPAPTPDRQTGDAQRAAAAWVYMSCVVAWAEDHDLVRPVLRHTPQGLTRTPASGTYGWDGRSSNWPGTPPRNG
jgi:hypothetical protein